jgi:hypothetical protein
MNSRALLIVAAAGLLSLAMSRSALAQGYYMGSNDNPNGPTVSPYLNLLQNNPLNPLTPTVYQSLVRPLVNQQNALQRQGGAIRQLQQQSLAGPTGIGRGTGHAAYFMNYSHFYPTATGR